MPTMYIPIILFVMLLAYIATRRIVFKKSHWQHFFAHEQFSAGEFYAKIRQQVEDRKLTKITVGRSSFLESNILSAQRDYLTLNAGDYIVYVFAGAFSTGTFVSWWLCIYEERFFNKIPLVSKWLGLDRKNKTFYQLDTENMYTHAIHSTIMDVIDAMCSAKEYRSLSEAQREFKDNDE